MKNFVQLIGNLGGDPKLDHVGDRAVLNFSVATNHRYKDSDGEWQEETEWHDVAVWGRFAESLSDRIGKGDRVVLEGKLTYREYEDKQGAKQRRCQIVCNWLRKL